MSRAGAWASLPKFRPGAFGVFVLAALASAILADQPLGRALLLAPGEMWSELALWQPLTANFVVRDGELASLIGTLVIQWMLGSELESVWTTRRYLTFVLVAGVVGYFATALLGLVVPEVAAWRMGGPTAIDLATVVGFAVVFGKRPLRLLGALPLTSRGLAALIVAVSLIAPLVRTQGRGWPVLVPWVVAMLVAWMWAKVPWRSGRSKPRKRKGHLRVVRPERKLLN